MSRSPDSPCTAADRLTVERHRSEEQSAADAPLRVLLADNHDSYTYNLFQLIGMVAGAPPLVLANDAPEWDELDLHAFDAAVIGPGPGTPLVARDFGRSRILLDAHELPVLGVCLGHQALGADAGARLGRARRPRHGHLSELTIQPGADLFAGIPSMRVVRYHSLSLRMPLPPALQLQALAEDGEIMGFRHRDRPHWGVQFHPESICTEHGETLIRNFLALARVFHAPPAPSASPGAASPSPGPRIRGRDDNQRVSRDPGCVPRGEHEQGGEHEHDGRRTHGTHHLQGGGGERADVPRPNGPGGEGAGSDIPPQESSSTVSEHAAVPLRALSRTVATPLDDEGAPDGGRVVEALFPSPELRIWLDSAAPGPDGERQFSYFCGPDTLTAAPPVPELIVHDVRPGSDLLGVLAQRLDRALLGAEEIPGPFKGGYLGYFGYELGAELGLATRGRSEKPDAVWLRSDRFAVLDHETGALTLVALARDGADEPLQEDTSTDAGLTASAARAWLDAAGARLIRKQTDPRSCEAPMPAAGSPSPTAPRSRPESPSSPSRPNSPSPTRAAEQPELIALARPREDYETAVRAAQEELRAGESYEICLTNTLRVHHPAPVDRARELDEYLQLRRRNPAANAAFLQLPDELTVFSSSPERFLRVDAEGWAESRPIKGTIRRSPDPGEDAALKAALERDPKTIAENLMIVDLVRNDLGRVSRTGTVSVPDLITAETLPAVHQLYSTIRGLLRPGLRALDAVRACFPGGSMTGAPKERTCEIIDRLEDGTRGIYSGALGWLGFDGAADLSIVIRTAVRHHEELSIGAGGAIVLDSDPGAEYREMLLKAGSVAQALL